ncbi:DUF2690 domain-containing protein [Streptomyces sp. NPDC007251]|uniref:helix-turn-helix domain-containing protein n=1 Tax=Streptomyces sp. NPDC007251 TaxID=3154483 RepID=UPI0033D0ECEC
MPRWKDLPEELDPQIREFTSQVRRLVDRSGLSVAALADRTGYSKTSWERYLGGRLLAPKGAVVALAEVTGTNPVHLTTMWELAERAWSRAEMRHDRTMEAIRIAQARAALGEFGAAEATGGPSSRKADGAGPFPGIAGPSGISPTIPTQPTAPDADARDAGGRDRLGGGGRGAADGSGRGKGSGSGRGAAGGSGWGVGDGAVRGAGDGSGRGSADGSGRGVGDGSGWGVADGSWPGAGDGSGRGAAGGSGRVAGDGAVRGAGDGSGRADGSGRGEDSGSGRGAADRFGPGSADGAGRGAADGSARGVADGVVGWPVGGSGRGSADGSGRGPEEGSGSGGNSWGLAGYQGPSKTGGRPGADVAGGGAGDVNGARPGASAGEPGRTPTVSTPYDGGPEAPRAAGGAPVPGNAVRQRVIMFLAGLVGVAVVIGAVFFLTDRGGTQHGTAAKSPSPTASTHTSPPPGVKCAGSACDGKDAEAMGCSGELVTTAKTAVLGTTTLEVRYSKTCGTAWGRITGAAAGDQVQVLAGEARQTGETSGVGDTIAYTPMVAVRNAAEAKACATLASGRTGCTK